MTTPTRLELEIASKKLDKLFVIWINQFNNYCQRAITAYQAGDLETATEYHYELAYDMIAHIKEKLIYYSHILPANINSDNLIENMEESLVTLEMVSQYQGTMVNPQMIYNYTKKIESEYA